MNLKQIVYNHFVQVVQDKINLVQKVLNDLKESGTNETRRTAGDKHETALAMLQIEQENKRAQLRELLTQQAALEKIDPSLSAPMVVNGSLVKTDKGYFFISTALGKAVFDGNSVIAISPKSPLGEKLMGAGKGATILINGITYVIENIE